jgi:hypothetical protein
MDTLKYEVYHKAFEPVAVHVANVWINEDVPVIEALEEVFRKTNNVEGSWSYGPYIEKTEGLDECDNPDYFENVEVVQPLKIDKDLGRIGHRSTSVGDFVIVDSTDDFEIYKCENFGWKLVKTSGFGKEVA